MRVIKKSDGTFEIRDEPTVIEGEAATKFLADMKRLDSEPVSAERRAYQEHCERIYNANRPKHR